jgi:hypothetical protein
MDYYAGIDVSLESASLCVVDAGESGLHFLLVGCV